MYTEIAAWPMEPIWPRLNRVQGHSTGLSRVQGQSIGLVRVLGPVEGEHPGTLLRNTQQD